MVQVPHYDDTFCVVLPNFNCNLRLNYFIILELTRQNSFAIEFASFAIDSSMFALEFGMLATEVCSIVVEFVTFARNFIINSQ